MRVLVVSQGSCLQGVQVLHHLGLADDIAVFGVNVEQVRFVRTLVAIADTLTRTDRPEAVLNRINGGCANASGSRATGNNKCIDVQPVQRRDERGTEERTGILLDDDRFASRSSCGMTATRLSSGSLNGSRSMIGT